MIPGSSMGPIPTIAACGVQDIPCDILIRTWFSRKIIPIIKIIKFIIVVVIIMEKTL